MVALSEAVRLFDTIRVLGGKRAHRERVIAQEAFSKLCHGWNAIRQHRRGHAPRHNLMQFLGYERNEVAFHSPFLCDLLDPNGTHDQGSLFLLSFLELLSKRAQISGATWNLERRELNDPGYRNNSVDFLTKLAQMPIRLRYR
jgi:PD-(D/E)XK nuclease superfamily